ncbi:nicotinate phosphoribosyltransferase [bacterium]|nr:MAG: nicotinate phosphoribosyltransferase [bacterium]
MIKNLSLLVDLYELTMAQAYFYYKKDNLATFDLFVREMPCNRSYLVAAGLEDALDYIINLRFKHEDLRCLRKINVFSEDFLDYLKNFRFRGEIWAMPEGTIFFANEPVIRVTGPIIEAQIIESFLLNTISLQTMIASKASRVVAAARGREVYDFSLRRTHGADAGLKVGRAAYLAGFSGTSNVLAGESYHIPVVGTMAHSYVMSFRYEIDSFLAYSNLFPRKTILLVDTYDPKKGIQNAITIGLYLKEQGYRLQGIRLDGGGILALSKLARRMFDRAGLGYVKIFASGNLDEFRIKDLLSRGAKIDSFGVGTNMGTSSDAPSLDVVYKISEVSDKKNNFLPTMKFSPGKITYPGRKQVFRVFDKNKRFVKDIIGLDHEDMRGKALLKRVLDKGKITYKSENLDRARERLQDNLRQLPRSLREVYTRHKYTVEISAGLKKLQRILTRQLKNQQ